MIKTEPAYSDLSGDAFSQASSEDRPYEPFYCTRHPQHKLEVLCTKENFQPSLLCIRCLTENSTKESVKAEDLKLIQDIIDKGTTNPQTTTVIQFAKEKFEQKFTDFSARDYLGIYERHVQGQMQKLDREIGRIKDSLEDLRFQFQTYFEKQVVHLKDKEEDVKKKATEYIEERDKIENLRFLTPQEIVEEIRQIPNVKDYEKFVKMLYHRSSDSQGGIENTMLQGVFEAMDNFKENMNLLKTCKLDTAKLEGKLHLLTR